MAGPRIPQAEREFLGLLLDKLPDRRRRHCSSRQGHHAVFHGRKLGLAPISMIVSFGIQFVGRTGMGRDLVDLQSASMIRPMNFPAGAAFRLP